MSKTKRDCERCGALLTDEEGICPTCGHVYGRETAFALPQLTKEQIEANRRELAEKKMGNTPAGQGAPQGARNVAGNRQRSSASGAPANSARPNSAAGRAGGAPQQTPQQQPPQQQPPQQQPPQQQPPQQRQPPQQQAPQQQAPQQAAPGSNARGSTAAPSGSKKLPIALVVIVLFLAMVLGIVLGVLILK